MEGRYGWVCVYFVLLANGTTSDEVIDEGRESRPPKVAFDKGFGAKSAGMSEGRGFMECCDEGLMSFGRDIHATLVVKGIVFERPVGEGGPGE